MKTVLEVLYNAYKKSPIVSIDSRKIVPGSIFFALKGDKFDGNIYAQDAIDKGAKIAVIDNKKYFINDEKTLIVDNVLLTLQKLAAHHIKQINIPVIAITGTNGKTTTKELIKNVLQKKYKIVATEGNYNNHIGVPLTLLRVSSETEIAVVEMGANHPGEIKLLCDIAAPDYGVITNIGMAHLEGFGSIEGVKKTKMELYNHIQINGKMFFLNLDDSLLSDLYSNKVFTYGTTCNCNISGRLIEQNPCLKVSWTSQKLEKSFEIQTQLPGSHNLINILCAISVGEYFNIKPDDINNAIESYKPDNNRSQIIYKKNTILLDAYNANPSSVSKAIQTLIDIKTGKSKVFILGDMLELGDYTDKEHQNIIELIIKNNLKGYFVGKNFSKYKHQYPRYKFYSDTNDFIKEFDFNNLSDSFILIKGSRGIGLEKVLDFIP
ncbi:MAG: UDP-N-acetylmuramoyl-tripeptide--D-alanyl-D-alanine ligase [Marinilabiliales bacterium]